jgi:nitrite reductase/ring-hydroxylating ferredoxin subunit/DMSO/TMAO reductase YedYZ heme-binding membrane subunit
MSVKYTSVLWNKQKKIYDRILWLGIGLFMLVDVALQLVLNPDITAETLIIRASGLSAIILLHLILIIGPLCRINPSFLPLLYNRRHAGVSMFLLAAVHGIFSIIQFHALGDINAIASVFLSNQQYGSISEFPFQVLGFFALIILFIMAATSHDFWLKNLNPSVWKILHMGVYIAYGLIVLHVATGAFQYESHPLDWLLLVGGFALVAGLHLLAGFKENKALGAGKKALLEDGFYEVGPVEDIPEDCAKIVFVDGENIAIFKYNNKVSAVHNVSKHQLGPLGEGKIIDGSITCPWHGYQYLPENGQSPPPFTEKVKTYQVKIQDEIVWINPEPYPEGTFVEPAIIASS